jgi:DNA-directed RNA polymerase subunit M
MVDFCPECSNLLRKKYIDGKTSLVCGCGYTQESETDETAINSEIQRKKDALDKNIIVVSQEDKVSVNLKVLAECPKCKHTEAEAWQEQTRSADEPSTSFFRCVKCRFTWREY